MQLRRLAEGGKVSFTHLIGWAVVRALSEQPQMNAAYAEVGGKPARVSYPHINLGLAMDLPRKDGGRTLLVPNLKRVDEMDFRRYWEAHRADLLAPYEAEGHAADGAVNWTKIREALHDAERRGFAFLEATEVYSGFLGVMN